MATYNYRVVEAIPEFDDFDCVRAWRMRTLAVTHTLGWAGVIRDRADNDGMDERSVEIRDYTTGKRVFRPVATEGVPF